MINNKLMDMPIEYINYLHDLFEIVNLLRDSF